MTKSKALSVWTDNYGDKRYARDFSGRLMCRDAYGKKDAVLHSNGKRLDVGWNIHHVLPKAKGGNDSVGNLTCTNMRTNSQAADKTTFWVDGSKYQVKKTDDGYNDEKVD